MAEQDRNDQRDRQRGSARHGEGRASAFQSDYAGGRAGGGGRPGETGAGRPGRGTREGGLGYGTGYGGYGGGDRGHARSGGQTRHGGGDWGNQGYGVAPHLLIGSGHEGEGWSEERRNRGPKGWTRSDERINEDVCERLMGEAGVDPSDVSVHVAQGVVTLTGTVPNRQMKYRIEELADRCPGVKDVDNQVRVNRGEGLFGTSGSRRESGRGSLLGRLFGFSSGTRIADVMTRNPQVVSPDEMVSKAARMMKEHDVGAIPVCDGKRLVGMVTDRDITIRAVAEGKPVDQAKIRDAMTSKVHWCYEDDEVEDVLEKMGDLQVRRIPVVDRDKHLVGIVALGDLSRHDAGDVQDALEEISERRTGEAP